MMLFSNIKYLFLSLLVLLAVTTKSKAANSPPKAPDCPKLAIPNEFITANYNTPTISGSTIAGQPTQVRPGGSALYSNIGTVNIGGSGTVAIDMKATFVSTSAVSDADGYIEFGATGSKDVRWRANNWSSGDIHNVLIEYFISGTSTPATYSGIWNFYDIDKPTSVSEVVYFPTNIVGSYLLNPGTSQITATTVGSDYVFTGISKNTGSANNPDYAFSTIIENAQFFTMKLQNGGGSTSFFTNGNNFNFIPASCTNSDQFSTTEDATISIAAGAGLLINDTDIDGDVLTISEVQGSSANLGASVTLASGAVIKVNANGSFTYNPNPAFDFMSSGQTKTDSFYYQVSDGHGGFDLGTVTITLTGINDAPVAKQDVSSTNKNIPISLSVLSNDTDVDGTVQASTVTISSAPSHGSTSVNNTTGVITYTPTTGYSGSDSFIYQVCDNGSPVLCDTAKVYMTVTNLCGIAIPAAPASCPTVAGGAKTLASGNVTFNSGDQGNYVFSGTSLVSGTLNINIGSSNTMNIYVCSGQTLSLNAINLNNGTLNFYILNGGTLKLTATVNAGNYYVYGTLNLNSSSLQIQNSSSLYVATSGIVYGGSLDLTSSAGLSYIEGLIDVSNFTIQKSTGPAMCINSSGCAKTSTVLTNNTTYSIQSELGTGYMQYTNTTGPCGVNNDISNTPSLNVCSKQTTACSAPNRWGTATVTINCTSPNATCINPLPISLLYFKATKSQEGVLLKWATSLQWDSDYFIIEKSSDGINWSTVGVMMSEGRIERVKEYSLSDSSPEIGVNYYRISEVDKKGNKKEYGVDLVEIEQGFFGFSIYPNPGKGDLNVDISGEYEKYSLEIFDITGKRMAKVELVSGPNNLGNILHQSGVYVAKLKVGINYYTQKLVVQ